MSHNFTPSGIKAVRLESPAAPAAEGEACLECGSLEDVHKIPKRTYLKRKVSEIRGK